MILKRDELKAIPQNFDTNIFGEKSIVYLEDWNQEDYRDDVYRYLEDIRDSQNIFVIDEAEMLDATFNKLDEMGITPIVDLCHFGLPDWLGNFQNPEFPFHFAEYAKAFSMRFPKLQLYTPINEIFIAAMFSAQAMPQQDDPLP